MNGVSRISGMGNMPVNCGMKGMHENQTNNQQQNSVSQSIQVSNMKNMSENCGMSGVHESSLINQVQADSSDDKAAITMGSKIDKKA